jgi:hypothetical protein
VTSLLWRVYNFIWSLNLERIKRIPSSFSYLHNIAQNCFAQKQSDYNLSNKDFKSF